MDIKKIPKELLEKRDVIECNFVLTLYKDMDLLDDYKNIKVDEDLITDDGKFYFSLIRGLKKAGYNTIDNISLFEYLEDKKTIKNMFEERGGYQTIKEITDLLSPENIEPYYDELVKNNLLIRLNNAGFNVLDNLNKFKQMSSDEVYDFFDYQLSSISVDRIEKIKIEDLSEGYEDWIKRMNEAKNVGFKVGSGLMDYQLAGVHRGNLTLYLGSIGSGKTSSSIPLFILPAIETGNDITILCNEQTSDDYRNMIISTVLFSKIKNVKGMNRMSITLGNYDDYKKEKIREAVKWIESQPGKIKFVELNNYDVGNVKKIIKKEAKRGCAYFFFDVLKSVNDASDKAWAELSDVAKALFMLAKTENVAIIASAQLASDSMNRKYLDLTSVGKSRAISECASTVIGFIRIHREDYEKIKPWQWKKNQDGSDGKVKITYDLDQNKSYIMQFIMKNRFGSTDKQIVQEFNQDFNIINDVGYFNAAFDNFRR